MIEKEALAILEEVFRREADRAFWASDETELLEALAVLRAGVEEREAIQKRLDNLASGIQQFIHDLKGMPKGT